MKTKEFKRLKTRLTKFPDKAPTVNDEVTSHGGGRRR